MPYRKEQLIEKEIYHIFSKSIANFQIFKGESDYERIRNVFSFYKRSQNKKFSYFLREKNKKNIPDNNKEDQLVNIIAYCIMPTHLHFALKQLKEDGISLFMKKVLDSYTRYFNTKTKRKGPLWESRFQSVRVESDEQLLHLTRYIHLNPVTAYLVKKPEDWVFSSYREFIGKGDNKKICEYSDVLEINSIEYIKFVEANIEYQRELNKIKNLFIE